MKAPRSLQRRRLLALSLPMALVGVGRVTASQSDGAAQPAANATPVAATPIPSAARPDAGAIVDAPVVPGRLLRFPDDEGSHPPFRVEWWYATGTLEDASRHPLGFQITFFRTRVLDTRGNPSRFAPAHLIVAHAALSDPRRGRLAHAQQIARAGFGLAGATEGMTDVRLGKWLLRADGPDRLRVVASDRELGLDLELRRTQPPLLHGDAGFSRKGPSAASASYYYTLPQLAVTGTIGLAGKTSTVTGTAWLDHEWSSAYMEAGATGWDWIGINLDDGGALMAFRMRDARGSAVWAGATLRKRDGSTQTSTPSQVRWEVIRQWRSARTGATYPVAWRVTIGDMEIGIEPLMDDQENDVRASTGTIYWEGAVTASIAGATAGRGYLELTGYWRPFRV